MSRASAFRTFRRTAGPPVQDWASSKLNPLQAAPVPIFDGLRDPAVSYWDRGVDAVPLVTGAASVMNCADLVDACARLGVLLPLRGRVLDIGCGTGRWQQFCFAYQGLDISPAAVEFAQRQGLSASLIEGYGPSALDTWFGGADWITCFSVFTHVGFEERHDYLDAFKRIAPNLLVDIIPGSGLGDVSLWTADVPAFEQTLEAIGWTTRHVAERVSPDGVCHRYYWCMHE